MINRLHPDMIEATRLTRAGRLAEATALLQRRLGISPDAAERAAPSADADKGVIDLVAERVTLAPSAKGEAPWRARSKARSAPRPSAPTGAGRFTARAFSCPAGSRAYKLYVPDVSGTRPEEAMPLVVMLHGCTQSADDFAAGTAMNRLADELGFIVAYPEQSQGANAQRCWNWFEPAHQRRGSGEPAVIAGLTREVMREHPVDPARVYIAGLSAGGAAAAVMGAAYPDLYAAVGVHSGLALGSASNLVSALGAMQGQTGAGSGVRHGVATIVFHGDADRTVHPTNGDAVIAAVSAKGLKPGTEEGRSPGGRAYTRMTGTTADGRILVEQWTIHGGGHAWSGGSAQGSYTDPRGPDASREMLRFFLTHRLDMERSA